LHKDIAVAMALMASTSVAGVSVLTGFNPCDVLVHSGAAAETAAPPCRARRGDDDAFELGGECATPLLVVVGMLSAPRHGFPRRLEGGQRAALASPRRDQGWTGSHHRPGGRYFIYRPPWVAVSRSILNRWPRLSEGDPVQTGR